MTNHRYETLFLSPRNTVTCGTPPVNTKSVFVTDNGHEYNVYVH